MSKKDEGFDLSSAQPVEEPPQDSGDFDMSSATPVDDDVQLPPEKDPTADLPPLGRKMSLNTPGIGMIEAMIKGGGTLLGLPAKAIASAYQLATSKPGDRVYNANHAMRTIDRALDYKPRTAFGKAIGAGMDWSGQWPQRASDAAGEYVTQKTGSRGVGSVAALGVQALPALLGAKYAAARTAARAAPAMGDAQAATLARANVNRSAGMDWDSLSRNVQEKLTALTARGVDFSGLDPQALARQSRLDQLNIPYTRGDVTRSGEQVTREETLSKAKFAGQGVREVRAAQDAALHDNLDVLREGTGAQATTREQLGRSVQDEGLRAKESTSKANYRKLFTAAEETQPDATVAPKPMVDLLAQNPEIQHLGFMKSWLTKAKVLGTDEDGNVTSLRDLNLKELNDLRKKAVGIARGGGTDGYYAGQAIKAIDQTMGAVPEAATAWRAAYDAFKAHKMEFEDQGAVAKQVGMKSRTDRTTALADTFDTFIRGDAQGITQIKKSLTEGGNEQTRAAGMQAWRNLQGATIDYLRDKAVGKRGIESDTSTPAGQRAFESGKKLQQFNSTFRDAYSELRKDGKIDAIFSPEQIAQLDEIYEAVGDVRTRPASRISGSATAANAMAMLEDFTKGHGLVAVADKIPFGGVLARWYQRYRQTKRDVKEAAHSPLDETVNTMTAEQRKAAVRGRIFKYGMGPSVGAAENPSQGDFGFARGGRVQRFGGGGPVGSEIKDAIKGFIETPEAQLARINLEATQAKAPKGMMSVLDQLIQQAPASVTKPEQWQGWLSPGRTFSRAGVNFPLKKDELDFTRIGDVLKKLKESQGAPDFELAPSPKEVELTPLDKAKANFHQWLRDNDYSHYDMPIDLHSAAQGNTPHPETGVIPRMPAGDRWNEFYKHFTDVEAANHGNDVDDEAAAKLKDIMNPEKLAAANLKPSGIKKEDLLNWLRANRPGVGGKYITDRYSRYTPQWLKGENSTMADLTQLRDLSDPLTQKAIQSNTGHFDEQTQLPLSWSRSVRSTGPSGPGRVINEIQSDVHGKASDKVATPSADLVAMRDQLLNTPNIPADLRQNITGYQGFRERLLNTGDSVPEGMSTRRRGYGPYTTDSRSENGQVPPIYEGVPYRGPERYGALEIRKLLARLANENTDENFLGLANADDQMKVYGESHMGDARRAGMKAMYDDSTGYPGIMKKLGSQYGLPFDPAHPVGFEPPSRRDVPFRETPFVPRQAAKPYDPDILRIEMKVPGGEPVNVGTMYAKMHKELSKRLDDSRTPDDEGVFHRQFYSNVNAEASNDFRSKLTTLTDNYARDISRAQDHDFVTWDEYHESTTLRDQIRDELGKMSQSRSKPTLPGPRKLRDALVRMEQLHDHAMEGAKAHNEKIAAKATEPEPPVPTINRPALLMSPEDRERLKRAGVALFTGAGAGLGLDAMKNDQQPQGFADGGFVEALSQLPQKDPSYAASQSAINSYTPDDDRPGLLRRLGAIGESTLSAIGQDDEAHFLGVPSEPWADERWKAAAATDPKMARAFAHYDHPNYTASPMKTDLGIVEGGIGIPAMVAGIGKYITKGRPGVPEAMSKMAEQAMPGIDAALKAHSTKLASLMKRSAEHFETAGKIEDAVRRKRKVDKPNGMFERIEDVLGYTFLGQVPASPTSLLSGAMRGVSGASEVAKLTGALAKAEREWHPHRSLLRGASQMASALSKPLAPLVPLGEYIGPFMKPSLNNYRNAFIGGEALNEVPSVLANRPEPSMMQRNHAGFAKGGAVEANPTTHILGAPIPALARLLSLAAHMNLQADDLHTTVLRGMRKPKGYAKGGVVKGYSKGGEVLDELMHDYMQHSWESIPGATSAHNPELRSASPDSLLDYHKGMEGVLLDPDRLDKLVAAIGHPKQAPAFDAPGVFEGQISPGTQSRSMVSVGPQGLDPADTDRVKATEMMRAYALGQDAAAGHVAFPTDDRAKADTFMVEGPKLTEHNARPVQETLDSMFGPGNTTPVGTAKGFNILNLGAPDFGSQMDAAREKLLPIIGEHGMTAGTRENSQMYESLPWAQRGATKAMLSALKSKAAPYLEQAADSPAVRELMGKIADLSSAPGLSPNKRLLDSLRGWSKEGLDRLKKMDLEGLAPAVIGGSLGLSTLAPRSAQAGQPGAPANEAASYRVRQWDKVPGKSYSLPSWVKPSRETPAPNPDETGPKYLERQWHPVPGKPYSELSWDKPARERASITPKEEAKYLESEWVPVPGKRYSVQRWVKPRRGS